MKRSEMVQLIYRQIYTTYGDDLPGTPMKLANEILETIEQAGIQPPGWMKPIPFEPHQYPLVPGDFQNDKGIWCTPGYHGWESEEELFSINPEEYEKWKKNE